MELTKKGIKLMENMTEIILIFSYLYIGVYTIITVLIVLKQSDKLARFLSNLVFLIIIISIATLNYIAYIYLSNNPAIPIVITILCAVAIIFCSVAGAGEATDGSNNGLFNIFNSIKKYFNNINDYHLGIKILKNKYKNQIT